MPPNSVLPLLSLHSCPQSFQDLPCLQHRLLYSPALVAVVPTASTVASLVPTATCQAAVGGVWWAVSIKPTENQGLELPPMRAS